MKWRIWMTLKSPGGKTIEVECNKEPKEGSIYDIMRGIAEDLPNVPIMPVMRIVGIRVEGK